MQQNQVDAGYVRLWRKTIDSDAWADPVLWRVFETCLMMATHKPITLTRVARLGTVSLEPGQFVTGRRSLRKRAFPATVEGLQIPHEATVWRYLLRLQERRMVRVDVRQGYSVVSIVNWQRYQCDDVFGAPPDAPPNAPLDAPRAHTQTLTPSCHERVLVCAQAAHVGSPDVTEEVDESVSTSQSGIQPDASRLLGRCDRHPLLMPFWERCRRINPNLPWWFGDEVEFAFQCGVTADAADKLVAAQPALLLNPRRLAERLIEQHTKRQGGADGGPRYKEIKHNPDGSVDLSEYR